MSATNGLELRRDRTCRLVYNRARGTIPRYHRDYRDCTVFAKPLHVYAATFRAYALYFDRLAGRWEGPGAGHRSGGAGAGILGPAAAAGTAGPFAAQRDPVSDRDRLPAVQLCR